MASTSNEETDRDGPGDAETGAGDDTAHLEDLPDGSGCAEVWEYTADERATEDGAEGDEDTEDGGDADDDGGE